MYVNHAFKRWENMHYALNGAIEDGGTHMAFFRDGEEDMVSFICAPGEFTAWPKRCQFMWPRSALNNLGKALTAWASRPL